MLFLIEEIVRLPDIRNKADRILMICQTLENRYPQIYDYNLVTKGLRQIHTKLVLFSGDLYL